VLGLVDANLYAVPHAASSSVFTPLCGKLVDSLGNYYRICLLVPAVCYAPAMAFSVILQRWPESNEPVNTVEQAG
jgi:hypothetical protein